MKKLIAWLLLLTLTVGLFAGCKPAVADPTEPDTTVSQADIEGINAAIDYLKTFYKDDGSDTPVDYERFGIVRIGGVPYTVVWTVDVSEDLIKIVVNDDGTVTIDINENCEEDTPYVLTATITDAEGNTATHSWKHTLPKAVDMVSIVKTAYALAPGESLPYESTLRGKITQVKTPYSEEYKNITVIIEVEGAEDMPIECYRLKGEGAEELAVGDIITVTGTLKNYNGTIEFDAGCVLVAVTPGERVEAPDDMKQIVDEAYALGANKTLPYEATLTGTITAVKTPYDEYYGNITVEMVVEGREDKPIVVYRLKGDGVDKIGVNDVITVKGYITNYVGTAGYSTIEFTAGCQLLSWEDYAAPEAPSDPKQIVDEAYALGANKSLKYEATLTGKITKVKTAYDPSYGNITVEMVIEGRENKPIVAYRMKGTGVENLDIGDIITVKGYIKNYVGDAGYSTIEFDYPTLVSYTKNSVKAPSDPVQIVKDAYALKPGAQLPYKATLTGVITKVNNAYDANYKNVTVTIVVAGAEDMPIKCFRLKGDGAELIGEGDTITVSGYIVNFQHSSGDTEVEFEAGCRLESWKDTGAGGNEPTVPPTTMAPTDISLENGDKVVIFAPAYNKALSADKVDENSFYNKGVDITVSNGVVSGYTDKEVWTVTKNSDGTYTFANGGKNIGLENEFSSMNLGAVNDDWIVIPLGNGLYLIRNVARSNYIEWYASKNNWSSYNSNRAATDDQFQLSLYVVGEGLLNDEAVELPEPETTVPPTTVPPTTNAEGMLEVIEMVESPVAGTPYKLYSVQKNLAKTLFFTGKTANKDYYLATDADMNAGIDVYLEATEGGYYLYFMAGETKTYIDLYLNGTYQNIRLVTEPSVVYTYNTEYNTLVAPVDGTDCYIGTYGTYETLSCSKLSYAGSSFPCHLGVIVEKLPSETEPPMTVPPTTEPPVTAPPATEEVIVDPEATVPSSGEGMYVLYTAEGKALTALNPTYNYGYMPATELIISGNSISGITAMTVFTLTANGDGSYTIQDCYGRYIYQTGTYNSFNVSAEKPGEGADWTLTEGENGYILTNVATSKTVNFSSYGNFECVSTASTELKLAPVAEMPEIPTVPPTTEPEATVPPTTVPPTTNAAGMLEVIEMVESPVAGTPYKLYSVQKNLAKTLFFTGKTANKDYYLATDVDMNAGIDVYLEAAEGGYYLYFMDGTTKTYIDMFLNGTYYNIRLVTEPSVVYTYNTEYNTLVASVDGTDCYIGTYGTYETLSCSKLSYAGSSFPCHLGVIVEKLPSETEPPMTVPPTTEPPVTAPPATEEVTVDPEATVPSTGEGMYVLYTAEGKALTALNPTFNYGYMPATELTISGNSISGITAMTVFTLTANGDGSYTIQDCYGRYIYQTGTYNSFNVSAEKPGEGADWTLTEGENGYILTNVATSKTVNFSSYGNFECVSTASTELKLAPVAEMPEIPTVPPTTEPPVTTEPPTTVPPTTNAEGMLEVIEMVESPVAGTPYKLYSVQKNLAKTLFFTGKTANKDYYLATDADMNAGIDVYLEAAEGGYYLYFMDGTTKTYIDMFLNGTYYNIRLVTEPSVVYTYNTEYNTLVASVDGTDCYIGTYRTFETLSCSKLSYAGDSFPSHLGVIVEKLPSETEPPMTVPPTTVPPTTVPPVTAPPVTEEVTVDPEATVPSTGEGMYVIYTAEGKALTALNATFNYGYMPATELTISGNSISGITAMTVFTLTANGDGSYTIQDCYGRYIYQTGTYNSFNVSAEKPSEGADWTLTEGENGYIVTNVATSKTLNFSSYGNFECVSTASTELKLAPVAEMPEIPTAPPTTEPPVTAPPATEEVTVDPEATAPSTGEGMYVIYTAEGKALTALNATYGYGYMPATQLTVSGNSISGITATTVFTLTANGDGSYTIQDCYGRYIYQTGTYNSFNVSAEKPSEGADWTLTEGENGYIVTNVATSKTLNFSSYGNFECVSTASTELKLAPVAEMPEIPTAPPTTEPPVTTEPPTTVPPTTNAEGLLEVIEMVESPVAGTPYKLYSVQKNVAKILYFAGTTANKDYYLATTEDMNAGTDVYLEAAEGGYYLYFMAGETKTYIDLYLNGTYYNIRLVTEPSAVYTYNTEHNTLVASVNGTDCYIGTYNTFETLSCSKLSYAGDSFPSHLGVIVEKLPSETEPPMTVPPTTVPPTTEPPVTAPPVTEEVTVDPEATAPSTGEGMYVIYTAEGKALTALNATYNYGYMPATQLTVSGNSISGITATTVFTLTANGDGSYTIQDCYGRYIHQTGIYNSFNVSAEKPSEGADWTLTEGENGYIITNVATSKTVDFSSYGNFECTSTASTELKLAPVDEMPETTVPETEPEVEETTVPETEPEVEESYVMVTAPEAGKAYKWAVEQGNVGKTLYFAGTTANQSYYLATTEDAAASTDVYLEATEGGFYLYFMDGETKTYIDLYLNGTYQNIRLVSEPSAVYTYNTQYNTLVAPVDGTDCYIGAYRTYETFSCSKFSYISTSFPSHFYALPSEPEVEETTEPETTEPETEPEVEETTVPETEPEVEETTVPETEPEVEETTVPETEPETTAPEVIDPALTEPETEAPTEVETTVPETEPETTAPEATGPSIGEGMYVIYTAEGKALTALNATYNYGYMPATQLTVSGNSISGITATTVFTLTANGDGSYTIQDCYGRYIYQTGTFNSFNVSAEKPSEGADWTLTEGENGYIITNVATSKTLNFSSYGNFECVSNASTELKLAPVDEMPETTVPETEPEVEETTVPETEPEVEESYVMVTAPEAGKAYKWAVEQGNVGKTLYFAGTTANQSYYLATTEDAAASTDVYLEATEGGFYLYFMDGETKTYIDLYLNGTYQNIRLVSEPSAVYTYNTQYNTLVAPVDGTDCYIGAYRTYETFSCSKFSYISTSFPSHFYALPSEPVVPETTAPEVEPETTVPETTEPETTVPETTVPETTVPETEPETEPAGDAVRTYTFADYKVDGELGGGEFSRDLDADVNFYISSGWFTTQARMYKGSYGQITSQKGIASITFNVGYKDSTFSVYTSEDGVTWTMSHEGVAYTVAYSDVTVDFESPVKYIKLDASNQQIRLESMTVTFADGAEPETPETTEAPTEAETEAPTEAETEAPTEAETEAETEAPTEAETEAPTEAETEAPTEAETEPETEPVADPKTITFDSTSKRTVYTTSQQVWVENGITVTNDKGSSTSNVADYSNPARFYKSSTVTIACPGMTKIEWDANASKYATALQSSISDANATVSVSGTIVTIEFATAVDSFSVVLSGGQVRTNCITVYAAESGSTEPEIPETTEPETTVPETEPETEPETTVPETEPETTVPETEPETTEPETEPVADPKTIIFDDTSKRTVFTTSQQVWEENGITVTNDKGSSTNSVADYSNPARFYKSSTVTVAYPGMTKIEWDANASKYATALQSSISDTNATVSVSGTVVTIEFATAVDSFSVTLTGGQVRADSITVSFT